MYFIVISLLYRHIVTRYISPSLKGVKGERHPYVEVLAGLKGAGIVGQLDGDR